MKKIFTAKTIEDAKILASKEFGIDENLINFKVIKEPKKGLFGLINSDAEVEAIYEPKQEEENLFGSIINKKSSEENTPSIQQSQIENVEKSQYVEALAENIPNQEVKPVETAEKNSENAELKTKTAVEYISSIIKKMGIENVVIEVQKGNNEANILIKGQEFEEIIDEKGDLLDAFQYLSSLVCNRIDREYFRITIDCNSFREKRNQAIETLTRKIASNVKRTGKTTAMESMNPYERRLVHSVIGEIEGVSSHSVGEEPYRKVVVTSDNKPSKGGKGRYKGKKSYGDSKKKFDITTSFEKDYKKPKPEDEMGNSLYSKIEF